MDDLINSKIGSLTVLEKTDKKSQDKRFLYKCLCDCGKYVYKTRHDLLYKRNHNINVTCGCRINSDYGIWNKKVNKYDLSNAYGIGYTDDGYKFYFDLEDYELIKDYCWSKHSDGYLRTCYDHYKDENGKRHNKYIMMHQLIAKKYNFKNDEPDHINGKPFDNRKENLRDVSHMNNSKNTKLYSNNKSGHKGVCRGNRGWVAYIYYNNKRLHLGTFDEIEDAIKAREDAEEKYFGEYNRKKEFL